jgi:hypothetical protein
MRELIPTAIPETYSIKPFFSHVGADESIRRGVAAFRVFMCRVCDTLETEGHRFFSPNRKPVSPTDYPIIQYFKSALIILGYHGVLSDAGDTLTLTNLSSLHTSVNPTGRINTTLFSNRLIQKALLFLSECGLTLDGFDTAGPFDTENNPPIVVSYPADPAVLIGLKVMAMAHIDLGLKTYGNDDVLARCDYRVMMENNADISGVLDDFLHPFCGSARDFGRALHYKMTDKGFDFTLRNGNQAVYARKNKKTVQMANSFIDGKVMFLRAERTARYAEAIPSFPAHFQKMIARGFGCDSRLFGEKCHGGCRGYRFDMDESIAMYQDDLFKWIDFELAV